MIARVILVLGKYIVNDATEILLIITLRRIRSKILKEISKERCGFLDGKGPNNAANAL